MRGCAIVCILHTLWLRVCAHALPASAAHACAAPLRAANVRRRGVLLLGPWAQQRALGARAWGLTFAQALTRTLPPASNCVAARCALVCVHRQGVGSAEDIDKGMRLGTNQPMGPLRLADFIGESAAFVCCRVFALCVCVVALTTRFVYCQQAPTSRWLAGSTAACITSRRCARTDDALRRRA